MTETTPDAEPLTTEYLQALQQRLASAHEAARRQLGRTAEPQKRNYDNEYLVDLSGLATVFGYTTFVVPRV